MNDKRYFPSCVHLKHEHFQQVHTRISLEYEEKSSSLYSTFRFILINGLNETLFYLEIRMTMIHEKDADLTIVCGKSMYWIINGINIGEKLTKHLRKKIDIIIR